jgi:hypothetical protein
MDDIRKLFWEIIIFSKVCDEYLSFLNKKLKIHTETPCDIKR